MSEEVVFQEKKNGGELKFLYYLQGELLTTSTCKARNILLAKGILTFLF